MMIRNVMVGSSLLLASHLAYAGYAFERYVAEIQVLPDRVRIFVGTTYGSCGVNEGWWGWSTSDPRHKDWLALVLSAQAQNRPVVVYDEHGSCSGPTTQEVGIERLSIK
jgi:hypothetical protein